MSELMQDMQTTSSALDVLRIMLQTLEASSKALYDVLHKAENGIGDTMDKKFSNDARVLKNFIKHMEGGGSINSVEVSNADQANLMSQLLQNEGIPFIATETETGKMFTYKDVDMDRFMSVATEAQKYARDRGHEMAYPEFMEKIGENQDFAKVEGLTAEEIAVFRREATKQNDPFVFSIKEAGNGTFEIYSNKGENLEKTLNDTLFTMGTPHGQKYAKELVPFEKNRETFVETIKNQSMGIVPSYIIDAENPTKIIELFGGKYKTHNVKMDENTQKIVDCPSRFSKEISHDIYTEMKNMGMKAPILLSNGEASSFIKGISRDGGLEISPRFSDSLEKFIGLSDMLEKQFRGKVPEPPIYEPQSNIISMSNDFREKAPQMTIYQNIPLPALLAIEKAQIEGVYTYNKGNMREVACTPEATSKLNTIIKETLAKDKGPLDTWLMMEKYKGHGDIGDYPNKNYYIVDAAFPDACLEISPQDVTYKDTETRMLVKAPEGMSRDNAILSKVYEMSAPIILSKEEYDLMNSDVSFKQQVIESHHVNPKTTNVIQAEQSRLDAERSELDSLIYSTNKDEKVLKKALTPAQQYVLKQHEKRNLDVVKQERKGEKEPEKNKTKRRDKSKGHEAER
jgi:hypothetical protein